MPQLLKSLCFSYALPQSSTLIPLFTLKWKRGWKKQQQPLLPVKLLVPPLTALTGESKAIKMTRRQIVCDTSKGLEKAGKLSSATSSSTLRREREEKKTQSRQARAAWSTQAPRLPRSPLGLPPDPNTDSSPATTRPMITPFPLSRSEGLINALICKWVPQ